MNEFDLVEVSKKELAELDSLINTQAKEIKKLREALREKIITLDSIMDYLKSRINSDKEWKSLSKKELMEGYRKLGNTLLKVWNPIHKCGTMVEQSKFEDWYCPKCNEDYIDQDLEVYPS